jgi:SAM-dependent methyltransferase
VRHDRDYNAEYYDAGDMPFSDVEFYLRHVTSQTRVLELGCGTGRVTSTLLESAANVVGVDLSEPMLQRARAKTGCGAETFLCGDITKVRLTQQFDLIIAPYRVLQALEHDAQVDGLFEVIRAHLAPGGMAILNVFHPNQRPDEMAKNWPREDETPCGERTLEGGDTLVMSDERKHLDAERQVLYPTLIYRRYRDGVLVDEHRNPICMRYYYPEQFTALIEDHGFSIVQRWGGYCDEPYGQGNELVVAFQ